MRTLSSITLGLAALTGLAACGQSEEALRNSTRDLMLVGCRNGPAAERAALAQAGVNVDQYCACAIDRTLRPLTSEQLKQISRNPNAVPGMEAAAMQCVREMVPAAATGNEAAGNETAPAAPETPAAAAEDGDAAEGNEAGGQ